MSFGFMMSPFVGFSLDEKSYFTETVQCTLNLPVLNIHLTQDELHACLFATKHVLAVPTREF